MGLALNTLAQWNSQHSVSPMRNIAFVVGYLSRRKSVVWSAFLLFLQLRHDACEVIEARSRVPFKVWVVSGKLLA